MMMRLCDQRGMEAATVPRHLLMGIVLLVVGLSASSAEAAKASARLVLLDQWVAQGSPVWLRARLVSGTGSLIQSVIGGERVEFQVNNQSLGPALTGGDGLAAARYAPPKTGTYTIKVKLVDNPRYDAEEAEALLLYGAVPRKVIVVSMEATQTPPKPPRFPFSQPESSKPMPKAAQVLTELSKKYQLIYMQGGEEAQILSTRRWLSEQDFPQAPLFIWRLAEAEEARTDQVAEELGAYQALGRFSLGVTRSFAEALAFQSLGIPAVVIVEEDEEVEIPKGARTATDWDAVPALIQ